MFRLLGSFFRQIELRYGVDEDSAILVFLLFLVAFFAAGGTRGNGMQEQGAHQFHSAALKSTMAK